MSPARRSINYNAAFLQIPSQHKGFQLPVEWALITEPPFVQPFFEASRPDYTYSNTNRTIRKSSGPSQVSVVAGEPKSSGKWYIEFLQELATNSTQANDWQYGMATAGSSTQYLGNYASSLGIQAASTFSNGFTSIGAIVASATVPNPSAIIGLAYNADAKKFWISIDGTYISGGNPVAGTNPNAYGWSNTLSLYPAVRAYNSSPVTLTIPTSWTYKPTGYASWA